MKLQLFLNDFLTNEMHLDDDIFIRDVSGLTEKEIFEYRASVIADLAEDLKGIFYQKISKAKKWEIFFVVESKMNTAAEVELYQ